jgi:ABC-type sugar transport system ATPase subunit
VVNASVWPLAAIVRAPKVFLFDEPLSNLDAALRGQTRIEIAKPHRDLDATTVYVTHDQVEAMTLAARRTQQFKSCTHSEVAQKIGASV